MKRIGITMGDPAGVGPEIILKVLCKDDVLRRTMHCLWEYRNFKVLFKLARI